MITAEQLRDSAMRLKQLSQLAVIRPDAWWEQSDLIHVAANRLLLAAKVLEQLKENTMPLNYRVIRHELDNSVALYEVAYDEGSKIPSHLLKFIIAGESLANLREEIENLLKALDIPGLFMNTEGEITEDKQ